MRVLLTGMSGVGKSSCLAALAELGLRVVDTDDGWCTTDAVGERVWDEERVGALLDSAPPGDVLVLAGCVANQGRFRDRLDLVVLLSAPIDVVLDRVRTRTNNPFGKAPVEVERIVDDHREVEPLLRASADHEVRTDRPLPDVVADVVRLIGLDG